MSHFEALDNETLAGGTPDDRPSPPTERQQFVAMLDRAGSGYGLRIDHSPAGETVMLEIENEDGTDEWFSVEFNFNSDGRLIGTACYRGEEG